MLGRVHGCLYRGDEHEERRCYMQRCPVQKPQSDLPRGPWLLLLGWGRQMLERG